jgi:hypothetical protein
MLRAQASPVSTGPLESGRGMASACSVKPFNSNGPSTQPTGTGPAAPALQPGSSPAAAPPSRPSTASEQAFRPPHDPQLAGGAPGSTLGLLTPVGPRPADAAAPGAGPGSHGNLRALLALRQEALGPASQGPDSEPSRLSPNKGWLGALAGAESRPGSGVVSHDSRRVHGVAFTLPPSPSPASDPRAGLTDGPASALHRFARTSVEGHSAAEGSARGSDPGHGAGRSLATRSLVNLHKENVITDAQLKLLGVTGAGSFARVDKCLYTPADGSPRLLVSGACVGAVGKETPALAELAAWTPPWCWQGVLADVACKGSVLLVCCAAGRRLL